MGASRSPSHQRPVSTLRQNTQRSHSARPQSHVPPKSTPIHTQTTPPAYTQQKMTRTMSLQGSSRIPNPYPPPTTTTSKRVVNPDRTMSLTTTTVRTYGSFQLISTKTTPIHAPPPSKKKAAATPKKKPLKKPQAPAYASSMQSIESDLDSVLEEDDSFYNDNVPGMPPAIYISDDNTSSTLASRPKSVSTPTKHHRISFSPVPSDEGHHQPPPRSVSPIKPSLKPDHHSRDASVSSNIDEPTTNSVYLAPNSNSARRQSRVSFSSSDAVNEYNAHHPPSAPPASKYSYEIIVPPTGGPSIVTSTTTLSKKTPAASAAAVSAASKTQNKTVNNTSRLTRRHSVQAAAAAAIKTSTSKTSSPVIAATPAPRTRAPAARSKALAKQVYDDDDDEDSSSGHSIYSDASDYPLSELSPPQIPSPKQSQQSPTKPVTVAAANFASQKHQPKPSVSGPTVEAAAAARSSSIRNSNGMAVPPSPISNSFHHQQLQQHQQQQQGGPNGVARRTSLRKNSKPAAQHSPAPAPIPAAASAASAAAIVLPSPSISHSYRALVSDNDEVSYAAVVMPITNPTVTTPIIPTIPPTTTVVPTTTTTPAVPSMQKLHGKYDHEEGVYDPYLDENQPDEQSNYSEDESEVAAQDVDDVISMSSDSSWIRDCSRPAQQHLSFKNTLRNNHVSDVDNLGVIRKNPTSHISSIAPPKKPVANNQQQKTWERVNPPSYNPQFFESTRHKPQGEYVGLERTLSNSSFDKERRKKKASSKFAFHSLRDARDSSMPPQQPLLPPAQLNGRSMSLTATTSRSSFAAADGPPLAQPFKSRLKDDSDSDYEGVINDTLKNAKVSKPRRSSFGGGPRAAAVNSTPAPAPAPTHALAPVASPPSPQKPHGFLSTLRKDNSHSVNHQPPVAPIYDLQKQLTPPHSFLPATKSRSPSSPSALADVPEEEVIPGPRKQTKLGALFAKRQHIVDMQNQRYQERKTHRSHSMTSASMRPVFEEAPPMPEYVVSDPVVTAPTLRNNAPQNNVAPTSLEAPPVPQTPAENGSAVPTTPKKKKFAGLRKAFGLNK